MEISLRGSLWEEFCDSLDEIELMIILAKIRKLGIACWNKEEEKVDY